MSHEVRLIIRGVAPSLWSYGPKRERQILGRSTQSDIQVVHGTVSRQHAEIWRVDGRCFIRDLESRNGTFVNSVAVQGESEFAMGDVLQLGQVVIDVLSSSQVDRVEDTDDGLLTEVVAGKARWELSVRNLSPGQMQVLRLLMQGLREKEVASNLFLSPHTVHTHVRHIYRILGVRSRAELMATLLGKNSDAVPKARPE